MQANTLNQDITTITLYRHSHGAKSSQRIEAILAFQKSTDTSRALSNRS